jgi:hypothetical protein
MFNPKFISRRVLQMPQCILTQAHPFMRIKEYWHINSLTKL